MWPSRANSNWEYYRRYNTAAGAKSAATRLNRLRSSTEYRYNPAAYIVYAGYIVEFRRKN